MFLCSSGREFHSLIVYSQLKRVDVLACSSFTVLITFAPLRLYLNVPVTAERARDDK